MAVPSPDEIWRDFDVDGQPHEPIKEEIRRYLNYVEGIAASNGMKTYPNKAVMDADTTQEDGQAALLYADPVAANNYPTVWIYNDATNVWVQGVDRITSVKATADAAYAVTAPLDAATDVLAGDILKILTGLDIGSLSFRIGNSPVYNWAIVNQADGVVFGGRRDGDIELMSMRIRITDSIYPFALTNTQDELIAAIGPDGYPVGGLTPDQTTDVEALIADAGAGLDPASRPVYLDNGALYETGPEGNVLIMDPSPYDFSGSVQRTGEPVLTTINRPFMVSTGTPVLVDRALGLAVPNAPEYLLIVPTIGQSNSVGVRGTPLTPGLTNPYPDKILKAIGLDVRLGLSADGVTDPLLDPATITNFDPLISMQGVAGAAFGVTICEGTGPGMLEPLDERMGITPRCVFFTVGRSGAAYIFLRKTKPAYTNTLAAVTKMAALARARGWVPIVPFILVAHGEADGASPTYLADLVQWQSDYNTDLKAITGQTGNIPFIMNQPSSFQNNDFLSLLAMNEAAATYPDRFAVAGPNYPLLSFYDADLLHFTGPGHHKLGKDYLARAALHQVFGNGWKGLRPKPGVAPTWDGTTLTVPFDIPTAPLVLDTTAVTNPGNYGFTALDDSGALPVSTVALADSGTKVAVTFGRAATTNRKLRYALTGYGVPRIAGNQPRGNLRDSTPTTPNWCVHSEIAF